MNLLRVGLIQQRCTDNRQENIANSIRGIRQAAAHGAHLVALQELHCGLYFCQTESAARFDLAEPIPGPATEIFGALAKELGLVIVTSLFERRAAGLCHNTAVV
ncbi:MAG: acyltransferase, partial [Proteobacteria bacterium]|nr:acyltransferase [Pseudomonadota bacterium]